MKILFISRAFPPVIGGIENQNFGVAKYLSRIHTVTTITNRRGKRFLPLFLIKALLLSLWHLPTTDRILLGDGVLSLFAWLLRMGGLRKKIICIVHGLDITYRNPLYQRLWIRRFFPAVDHFIAVSGNTRQLLIDRGVPSDRISVIPNGVDFENIRMERDRRQLESLLGRPLDGQKLLLSIGRLIERKGIRWFVAEVMPQLNDDLLYLVAGSGPEEESIRKEIEKYGLLDRVILLGKVSDPEKSMLLSNADLFIQPNIPITGDVEGFGIAVIEASAHGLPVLASRLEGLTDAIIENENGWLVPAEDPGAFRRKITELFTTPDELEEVAARSVKVCRGQFDWAEIVRRYSDLLNQVK